MKTSDFEDKTAIADLLLLAFAFGEMCAASEKFNGALETALHHAARDFYARFKDKPVTAFPEVR